jgi:hypothetical protein
VPVSLFFGRLLRSERASIDALPLWGRTLARRRRVAQILACKLRADERHAGQA